MKRITRNGEKMIKTDNRKRQQERNNDRNNKNNERDKDRNKVRKITKIENL
jgi:hypothetical protein